MAIYIYICTSFVVFGSEGTDLAEDWVSERMSRRENRRTVVCFNMFVVYYLTQTLERVKEEEKESLGREDELKR